MKELKKFIDENEISIIETKKENINLKDESINFIIDDNKKHLLEFKTDGRSSINEIVNGDTILVNNKIIVSDNSKLTVNIKSVENRLVIIYDEIWLSKNSSLEYTLKSKAIGRLYHVLLVFHGEKSKSKASIRSNVKNEFVSIGKLVFNENATYSSGDLEQLVITSDKSKATLLPILIVKNKSAVAHHRAKKIMLRENDLFYLRSKTLNKRSIDKIIENFMIG